MNGRLLHAAAWLLAACGAAAADDPAPSSFAWRATLDTAGHSGLVRLALPGEALARLQTPGAADLRVFDAQGRPVAFTTIASSRPEAQARRETAAFQPLPLYALPSGEARPPGGSTIRIEENGERRSVWVQLGTKEAPSAPAGARALPAALFDTRGQQEAVTAFVLRARMPANVPVRFTLATSPDLEQWTPVPARGRIFRFDGEGAPANDRLELQAPLQLRDRYLRVDWSGQEGVALESLVGLLAAQRPELERPALALGTPVADGSSALEWPLGFATPIAQLALVTTRENTVLPLRVLGRNQPSEPWRLLGSTVAYRLGAAGQDSTNPPLALPPASVRWLRVEATHGARLDGAALTAKVLFDPLEVVFPAGADTPYQLVAGRAGTPAAALPAGMLAATTSTRLDALPLVRVSAVQMTSPPDAGPWAPWLPRGLDTRAAGLWLVLGLGVLVLGAAAWMLLRQMRSDEAGR